MSAVAGCNSLSTNFHQFSNVNLQWYIILFGLLSILVYVFFRNMDLCMDKMYKSALEYIDQTGTLSAIKEKCKILEERKEKTFNFQIPIDPFDLHDLNSDLGNLLISDSLLLKKIFQQVVHTTVQALHVLPESVLLGQVIITLKIHKLPECYSLKSCKNLCKELASRHYLQYTGIVIGFSSVHQYTKTARYLCSDENCPASKGHHYIRLHVEGALETQTIRKDFPCSVCGDILKEDVSSRVLGDRIILYMVDVNTFTGNINVFERRESIAMYLRDESILNVDIGEKCTVIGVLVHDMEQDSIYMEANNVVLEKNNITAHMMPVPGCILKLKSSRLESPWSFSLSLAYAFAESVSAPGTYLHLKLGLLLSIVGSVDTKHSRAFDVLAVGNDDVILQRLLLFAAKFASRYIVHSCHNHLTASVVAGKQSNVYNIQGGSLLLAKDGICVIRDATQLRKSQRQDVTNVLERGSVVLSCPSQSAGGQQLFLPLKCKLWSHLPPKPTLNKTGFIDSVEKVDVEKSFQALANVFGMIYFADMVNGSYAENISVQQILLTAMNAPISTLFKEDDIGQFLQIAQQKQPIFTQSAENLIKGYYVSSRRVRTPRTENEMAAIQQRALSSLMCLAESHAKLNLREEVIEEDAVLAIVLFEESMAFKTGYSILNTKPLPHIIDSNLTAYIGPERDNYLRLIHANLRQFIIKNMPDTPYIEE